MDMQMTRHQITTCGCQLACWWQRANQKDCLFAEVAQKGELRFCVRLEADGREVGELVDEVIKLIHQFVREQRTYS